MRDSTTGFAIVRVNGVEVINATGLDTEDGGTKTVYDTIRLGGRRQLGATSACTTTCTSPPAPAPRSKATSPSHDKEKHHERHINPR